MFASAPLLTITGETTDQGDGANDDIHLHAGGQGVWIARQLAALGVDVALCATFGGETGTVLETLVAGENVELHAVATLHGNGAYVHDRRSGVREEIAALPPGTLSRHELDELYGVTLAEALHADVTVLGGPGAEGVIAADTYRRMARDLGANNKTVIADLSGADLDAAVAGGLTIVKVSHEELHADGRVTDPASLAQLVAAMEDLVERGAEAAVVTRAEAPTLALLDGELVTAVAPSLEPIDNRGAGDSLTAGLAAALARGSDRREALILGVAAGAMNVTRRGLATGSRAEIERLADLVRVEPAMTSGRDHPCEH